MTSSNFDLDAYLDRIGLEAAPSCNADGLRALHHAQFYRIRFENFSIQLGLGILLDPSSLTHKLIAQKRGGYCFELNGLLLLALRALGFAAKPLLARVHMHGEPGGHTHQLNHVNIGDEGWIIDTGFGAAGPRFPMRLVEGSIEQSCEGSTLPWSYALEQRSPWGWVLKTLDEGTWKDRYSFTLAHVTAADLRLGNHYTSTSPESHFTSRRVASLPTPTGRVSLRDFDLTRLDADQESVTTIAPGSDYLRTLEDVFGIHLDADYEDLRHLATH